MAPEGSIAALLARLEEISRTRPDRLLRLRGMLPADPGGDRTGAEPFELLIFRGFSSSVTHPTSFDPDQPALPEGTEVEEAELAEGPLLPGRERVLRRGVVSIFLERGAWEG
jgi:hypothetical protein